MGVPVAALTTPWSNAVTGSCPSGLTRRGVPTLPPVRRSSLGRTNERCYDPAREVDVWTLTRVKTYLSHFVFRRKLAHSGQVTLFANTYSLGLAHSRRSVEIRFDSQTEEWLVADEQDNLLRRLPCQELDYTLISQLQLAK